MLDAGWLTCAIKVASGGHHGLSGRWLSSTSRSTGLWRSSARLGTQLNPLTFCLRQKVNSPELRHDPGDADEDGAGAGNHWLPSIQTVVAALVARAMGSGWLPPGEREHARNPHPAHQPARPLRSLDRLTVRAWLG
jgi:hypothetical protein